MGEFISVKLKLKGLNALMTSAPVQSEVARRAQKMATQAGDGFKAVIHPHKFTARAFVQTDTASDVGARRQAEEHVLEKLLGVAPGTTSDSGRVRYTTRDGRSIFATPAQVANWTSRRK